MLDTAPGEVAVGVVADSLRRSRIQVDVGVLAPDEPGRPAPRAGSQETTEVQGHESLVTLSGYTGPRAACQ